MKTVNSIFRLALLMFVFIFYQAIMAKDSVKLSSQERMTSWNNVFSSSETIYMQVMLSAHEAAIAGETGWQLLEGSKIVCEGNLSTRTVCELRGKLPLKNLPSGQYNLRVFVNSEKEEILSATMPVTVASTKK